MKMLRSISPIFLLLTAVSSTYAQQHSADCWLQNKSVYRLSTNFVGTQPSAVDIRNYMQTLAVQYTVPIEVIAVVSYKESTLLQYNASTGSSGFLIHNLPECKAAFSNSNAPVPPGLGLMQLTGTTASDPTLVNHDVLKQIIDWRYNLEAGVQVLLKKYKAAIQGDPTCLVNLRSQTESQKVLENWYYAIQFYNGSNHDSIVYRDDVYSKIANPPSALLGWFPPVNIVRPESVISNFNSGTQGFYAGANSVWTNYQCNTYSGTVHVSSSFGGGGADLALQAVSVAHGTYHPGDNVTIPPNGVIVTNVGGNTSASYTISYYLSTDTTINSSDISLGTSQVWPGLAAGTSQGFQGYITIPSITPSRTYYVGAVINVTESNTSNNSNYDPTPITVTAGTPTPTPTPSATPAKAINPNPSNGAIGQPKALVLSWSNGGGATSYQVYFGTDSTPDSGEDEGERTTTTFTAPTLSSGTTYYWRIDAKNAAGTNTGNVWSFTTGSDPSPTPSPSATPRLALGESLMTIGYGNGGGNALIYNTGSGTMNWSASSNASWLTVNTTGGSVSAGGHTDLSFTTQQNQLSQPRDGTITVTAPGAANSPQTLTILQAANPYVTPTPAPPTVQTLNAKSVSATSAAINGTVTSTGGAPIDSWYFIYDDGANPAVGIDDSRIQISGNNFSAELSGLIPGVAYRYRAYAHNSSTVNLGANVGWGFGSRNFFITAFPKPDFNRDGNSDVIWQNRNTGQRYLWLMTGPQRTWDVDLGIVPTEWDVADTGDFNRDGNVDILWQNRATGQRYLWLMTGSKRTADVDLGIVPTVWDIVGTADFNGDGNPDILWQNRSTGQRYLWLMTGPQRTSDVDLGIVPTEWSVAGLGDFNGDGKGDILWQNRTTGQRYLWLMSGVVRTSDVDLGVVSTEWDIVGTSDFNRDSNTDILWQNRNSGQRYLWLMSRTQHTGDVSLGSVPTEWDIRNR